jgi:hydroxyethylthiazole kinase-like uncharacterized protein yjeF
LIPILRPADVKAIDERALRTETLDAILERVGAVVADEALDLLGDDTSKSVVAIAGPGLNGSDARAAAAKLHALGVSVEIVEALELPRRLSACDLILDGAFGIGLSRPWTAPDTGDTPVLAIDIPSGIDGTTGEALGEPLKAERTITLGGYKAGLLFGDGPDYCGEIRVGDIGLGGNDVRTRLVELSDVARWLPQRPRQSHKWNNALFVCAGSPGMTGAARLASGAAMRAGAGYVHLIAMDDSNADLPIEVVSSEAGDPRPDLAKFCAALVGPGLGRSAEADQLVAEILAHFDGPVLIDGDGLSAIAQDPMLIHNRSAPTVLTPHDGEYRRLMGEPPANDRMEAALLLAKKMQSIVLLKGPATVIASPDGDVRVTNTGDQRLATAGTGDVLAGIVGALLAQGVDPFDAAAAGAFLHGAASQSGHPHGLIASDLLDLIPAALHEIVALSLK